MDIRQINAYQIALHTERAIDAAAVRALYEAVHWWPDRQPAAIAAILGDAPAVGAWDGDRLIGFARAVTDGVFRAYIEDVVVEPAYRRRGLATQMLRRLLAALADIETISLFCGPDLAGLYERLGFKASKSQVVLHRTGGARS